MSTAPSASGPIAASEPIAVIGAGIAGLSTAYHLARAGRRVVVLERDAAPGLRSSARSAAILRSAGENAAVSALTRETARFLHAPPAGFGGGDGPLVDGRGLVLLAGAGGAEELGRLVAPAVAAGDAAPLALDALRERVPAYRAPHGAATRAWIFPREGAIDVARLLLGLAEGARAAGAELRLGAGVGGLERGPDGGVRGVILADGERLAAPAAVLAAGAWAADLGARAGSRVRLAATRRHLAVLFAAAPAPARAPILWDVELGFYARPERGGLLCCACDRAGVPDPDRLALDPDALSAIRAQAERSLALPPVDRAEAWVGLRTMTADDGFALGADPDVPGLFWAAGLGGAGIGAGFAAGRLTADLVQGRGDPLADAVSPARLIGG